MSKHLEEYLAIIILLIKDKSVSFMRVTSRIKFVYQTKDKRYLGQYRYTGCDKFPIYCCTVSIYKYKLLCRNGEGQRCPVTRTYVPTGSDVPFKMGRGVFSTNFFLDTEIENSVLLVIIINSLIDSIHFIHNKLQFDTN